MTCGGALFFWDRFDAGNWLDAVQRLKITQSVTTPNNIVAVIKDPRVHHQYGLSLLELITSIGAPLSATTQQRAMEILKGLCCMLLPCHCPKMSADVTVRDICPVPIVQKYAATKTLGLALPRWGKDQATRPDTIEWLLPGMEALLLDPTTREPLPINKDGPTSLGELVVRGPNVFTAGYFQRPAETEAAFATIGGKSWLRMGDLVVMEADRCLTVVDRCKETFGVNGNQVIQSEIEAELLKTHHALDVAVAPIPAGDEAQVPCAAVVPRSKTVLSDPAAQVVLAKTLTDAIARTLAPYKHLAGGVVFVDAIPRNSTVLERLGLTTAS
ncbi:4-coumarate--CoA ligase-like 5 [Allomyces javanicus]|nr:4-coumarate--CoA ligase-like 5 [Allomyces javanicus]